MKNNLFPKIRNFRDTKAHLLIKNNSTIQIGHQEGGQKITYIIIIFQNLYQNRLRWIVFHPHINIWTENLLIIDYENNN